ncbi:alpha/beta hydrolase [Lactovum odontotermitis]
MANLSKYTNIFADLSQSAYTGREASVSFPRKIVDYGDPSSIDYTKYPGGDQLPNNGIVYLQPDTPIMSDKVTGFNSYFVTNQKTLKDTTQAYFVVRGSDGIALDSMNDWVLNDAAFALVDVVVPQALYAKDALHQQIQALIKASPNAKVNVTAHSLGTMVSIQTVASLPSSDIDKIDQVVLFNGPDARKSIEKIPGGMENIKKLEERGAITYYVNPFDFISMLNRDSNDQIGNVELLVPKSGQDTFTQSGNGSSHDFGQYRFKSDGTLMTANLKDNPELFAMSAKLSALIKVSVGQLQKDLGLSEDKVRDFLIRYGTVQGFKALGNGASAVAKFYLRYEELVKEYSGKLGKESQADIQKLQSQISSSSGSQKISLQEELLSAVEDVAIAGGYAYKEKLDGYLDATKGEVEGIVSTAKTTAHGLAHYLTGGEVDELLMDFKVSNFWDGDMARADRKIAEQYQSDLEGFSNNLRRVADNMKEFDATASRTYFDFASDTAWIDGKKIK